MIKLIIKYSPEYEVERVKGALGRLPWYKDNGYDVKLPEGIVVNPNTNFSEDQVKDFVNKEFNENDFKIQEAYLLENWRNVIDEASVEITKTPLTPRDTYIVYMTKYGVGGSYHYPDSVIVNIKCKYGKGLLRTVFHEMVHLMIEPWIVEYKVGHWQKERIVDLLITKSVPQISRPQQIPVEIADPVDKIFNEHYPNIELIIKNVGLLSYKK